MTAKEFERELEPLQVELVKLQEWVKATGAKICIVFEGRDAAGKGGTIKRIAERVSPRVFRVVALPAPTPREKSQMYIQRYVPHLPAAGEVVIFDRSWYNRAGVERVMGFTEMDQVERFLEQAPAFEKTMVESGHHPVQEMARSRSGRTDAAIGRAHQRRPKDLEVEPDGPGVVRPLVRLFLGVRDAMFAASDRPETPWYVIDSNEKRRARLNCIAHLLSVIPYEEIPRKKVTLPKRQTDRRLRGAGLPVPPRPPALLTVVRRRRQGPLSRNRWAGAELERTKAEFSLSSPRPPVRAGEEERQPLGPANRAEDALLHAMASTDRGCGGQADPPARRAMQILCSSLPTTTRYSQDDVSHRTESVRRRAKTLPMQRSLMCPAPLQSSRIPARTRPARPRRH